MSKPARDSANKKIKGKKIMDFLKVKMIRLLALLATRKPGTSQRRASSLES